MQVKQANDFSGQGNDFQLASGASYPTTAVGAGGGSTVDHFNVALPSTPNPFKATAGSGFTVTVTAKDVCGNTASAYSGSPTLSGTLNDAPNGTHPSYGALSSFSSGQATGTVTAYKAETGGTITATAGTVTGTSSSFEVLPGAEDHMSFTQEPSDVQKATAMSPAVTVKIFDQWDNVKTNATGSMTLALNRNGSDPTSGSGTLTGGTATPSSGVATFSGLKINTSHTDYYLTASFGSATDEDSTTFKVLDSLINCSAVTGCHGHINNGKYSVDTTVPGGGDAGTLGLSLSGLGDSYGTCTRLDGSSTAGATPMGYQTVVPPSGYTLDHPITVVVVYPKSVAPGTGVANFILCKTYEETPPVVGAPVPGSYEMPDCPKSGAITAACISDRHRVGAGDLQVTMKIDSKDPVPSGLRGG